MKKILLAEDDIKKPKEKDYFYRDLKEALVDKGGDWRENEIIVARNGVDSHNLLIEQKFDRIILDIMMPPGPEPPEFLCGVAEYEVGVVLLRRIIEEKDQIKKYPRNLLTPVTLLTGTAIEEIMNEIERIRMDNKERIDLYYKPSWTDDIISKW